MLLITMSIYINVNHEVLLWLLFSLPIFENFQILTVLFSTIIGNL